MSGRNRSRGAVPKPMRRRVGPIRPLVAEVCICHLPNHWQSRRFGNSDLRQRWPRLVVQMAVGGRQLCLFRGTSEWNLECLIKMGCGKWGFAKQARDNSRSRYVHDRRITQSLEAALSMVAVVHCNRFFRRRKRRWSANRPAATGTGATETAVRLDHSRTRATHCHPGTAD